MRSINNAELLNKQFNRLTIVGFNKVLLVTVGLNKRKGTSLYYRGKNVINIKD